MEALPSDRPSPEKPINDVVETVSQPPLAALMEPTLNVEPLEDRVLLASDMTPAAIMLEPPSTEQARSALIGPAIPGTHQDPLTNVHAGSEARESIAEITADQTSDAGTATPSEKTGSSKPTAEADLHAEPVEKSAPAEARSEPEQAKGDVRFEPEDPIATIEPEDGSRATNADYERLVEGASVVTKLEAAGVIDEITADVAQQAALRQS